MHGTLWDVPSVSIPPMLHWEEMSISTPSVPTMDSTVLPSPIGCLLAMLDNSHIMPTNILTTQS